MHAAETVQLGQVGQVCRFQPYVRMCVRARVGDKPEDLSHLSQTSEINGLDKVICERPRGLRQANASESTPTNATTVLDRLKTALLHGLGEGPQLASGGPCRWQKRTVAKTCKGNP